jgi:hypothetical protein
MAKCRPGFLCTLITQEVGWFEKSRLGNDGIEKNWMKLIKPIASRAHLKDSPIVVSKYFATQVKT